jgi:hypothetical protein
MNAGGWIIMLSMLTLVWSVAIWSYVRLLSAPRRDGKK